MLSICYVDTSALSFFFFLNKYGKKIDSIGTMHKSSDLEKDPSIS